MKKVVWLVGIFLVLMIGYIAAGPFVTFSAIKTSIREQDSVKLSENIDFSKLRKNLKEQLIVAMMKDSVKKLKNNPYQALAAVIARKTADGIVDSFVTPSGIASIMEENEPAINGGTESMTPPNKDNAFNNTRFSYDSMNSFSIWFTNEKGKEIRLVLNREGVAWKLVNIIIPLH